MQLYQISSSVILNPTIFIDTSFEQLYWDLVDTEHLYSNHIVTFQFYLNKILIHYFFIWFLLCIFFIRWNHLALKAVLNMFTERRRRQRVAMSYIVDSWTNLPAWLCGATVGQLFHQTRFTWETVEPVKSNVAAGPAVLLASAVTSLRVSAPVVLRGQEPTAKLYHYDWPTHLSLSLDEILLTEI